tara:strand:+ start:170716 stop:171204 length:489 start_codon:yes stop_codon:yes gene_type:complete
MSETQTQASITVPMNNQFPIQRITDLMVGAFEQSCGYWAQNARHELPEGFDMEAWREANGFTDRWSHGGKDYQTSDFYLAPFVGGVIIFDEITEERTGETEERRLDLAAIQSGLALMAAGGPENKRWGCGARHYADWIAENDDAETADVFLQACVLGDIVYG